MNVNVKMWMVRQGTCGPVDRTAGEFRLGCGGGGKKDPNLQG